jgi:hypothetical protein
MKISEALKILDLHKKYNTYNLKDISLEELKKSYHIKALNIHPDKNNSENSKENFQNLQEAYIFLKKTITLDYSYNNAEDNFNDDEDEYEIFDSSYTELIINFINILTKIKNNDSSNLDYQENVKKIKSDCYDYTYKLLEKLIEKLNIDTLEDIYLYLSNNYNSGENIENIDMNMKNMEKDISNNEFSFKQNTLIIIKKILLKKLEEYNIYIINPTLKNLLNQELYKMELNDEILCIPLWHNELKYENNIIKIVAIIDNNYKIGEDNNLHYYYYNTFENLINIMREQDKNKDFIPYIEIIIEHINIMIPLNELKLTKYQIYKVSNPNIGIPKINHNNILDVSRKGDILIHLNLS